MLAMVSDYGHLRCELLFTIEGQIPCFNFPDMKTFMATCAVHNGMWVEPATGHCCLMVRCDDLSPHAFWLQTDNPLQPKSVQLNTRTPVDDPIIRTWAFVHGSDLLVSAANKYYQLNKEWLDNVDEANRTDSIAGYLAKHDDWGLLFLHTCMHDQEVTISKNEVRGVYYVELSYPDGKAVFVTPTGASLQRPQGIDVGKETQEDIDEDLLDDLYNLPALGSKC